MREVVEQRVRQLMAEHLGVGLADLKSHVSLRDDLAADSLDLLEVSVALEDDLDISMPESLLDEVRTVGDLVEATVAIARRHRTAARRSADVPVRLTARIVATEGPERPTFERSGWLTPYLAEAIADDVLHAGPNVRLEVTVAAATSAAGAARVGEQFAWLATRGIDVQVRRDGQAGAKRGQLVAARASS